MSFSGYGRDASLSTADLAAAVAAVRPDWGLVDAEPMPEGSDIVYGVTVRDGDGATRDAVLKCFHPDKSPTHTPERFLVEVDLIGIAARETDLPVPERYGVRGSHESAPTPAFLMERLPGESPSAVADPVAADAAAPATDRLLRESGRYLARIHDLRTFEAFGDLVTDADRTAGDDPADPVVRDGHRTWTERLGDLTTFSLDGLDGTRFADLEPRLREYADERLTALDLRAEAALLHGDFRPGNLLADPETGSVTAVLDWGAAQAGDPRYELAWAVREFSGRSPLDSPAHDRVRDALFEAYEAERGTAFDRESDAFEERQRFYRAVTWITECRWFEYWWADADEAVREGRAARLRENVRELR